MNVAGCVGVRGRLCVCVCVGACVCVLYNVFHSVRVWGVCMRACTCAFVPAFFARIFTIEVGAEMAAVCARECVCVCGYVCVCATRLNKSSGRAVVALLRVCA